MSAKSVLAHVVEITIAATLLYFDIRYFLMFLFLHQVYSSFLHYNHLRALIRVFNITTEIKLLAICRRLGITDEEMTKVMEEQKKRVGPKTWRSVEKDWEHVFTG